MNTKEKSTEVRYCGKCTGEDTMLICCECMRIEKEKVKSNTLKEVEKIINNQIIIFDENKDREYRLKMIVLDAYVHLKQRLAELGGKE